MFCMQEEDWTDVELTLVVGAPLFASSSTGYVNTKQYYFIIIIIILGQARVQTGEQLNCKSKR